MPVVAPSSICDKMYNKDIPHELSEDEIEDIIYHFVKAAERAKTAGFDGVQLHMAHGFLLSSFLSPHMNKRKDKWGGNTENRFGIVREIIRKIKENDDNFPVWVKMNGYEISDDGLKTEEAVKIAKYLEAAG
jgi:2,4-dienoyl-CoA reductase-like NADH-dependent reductase (Old Yellow Enzyme family)